MINFDLIKLYLNRSTLKSNNKVDRGQLNIPRQAEDNQSTKKIYNVRWKTDKLRSK